MSEIQPEYRLKQYLPGAWCIEQKIVTPEINKRTGKKNKHPGTKWKEIQYPGNLRQAAERLLSLVTGLDAERDVIALKDAVIKSEAQISANVEAYVIVREGDDE